MRIKFIIFFLIIFCSFSIFLDAQADRGTGRVDYSSQEFENMVPSDSCSCIAFRFDDIQNGWLSNIQLEVISKFTEKNIPLTIGILGDDFRGYMATYVKLITNEDNSTIEIANHGWLHEDFSIIDKETQSHLMEKTNKKIFDVTGKYPKIFVPPFNVFNNDTIKAMKENNFTHYSPSVVHSKPPYPLVNSDLYNFPETSTTGTISPELGLFEGISHTETLKDIQASQNIFGFSVITLHPQEFSLIKDGAYSNQIDQNQIRELDMLFDEIQKSNLKIVFLSQINEHVIEPLDDDRSEFSPETTQTQIDSPLLQPDAGHADTSLTTPVQKIPEWLKYNAGWWAKDMIEDAGFTQAIQYLISEGIMILPETTKTETVGGKILVGEKYSDTETEIPSWIKNTAEWWAQGLITDNDFVKGIQYLVENGIIKV